MGREIDGTVSFFSTGAVGGFIPATGVGDVDTEAGSADESFDYF